MTKRVGFPCCSRRRCRKWFRKPGQRLQQQHFKCASAGRGASEAMARSLHRSRCDAPLCASFALHWTRTKYCRPQLVLRRSSHLKEGLKSPNSLGRGDSLSSRWIPNDDRFTIPHSPVMATAEGCLRIYLLARIAARSLRAAAPDSRASGFELTMRVQFTLRKR